MYRKSKTKQALSRMNKWLESMEPSSEDEDGFENLVEKLRHSRKKEKRHSEEKVTMLESILRQQKEEIEDLRKSVQLLKSQEFQRKAKYEETSSAPSLSSEESDDDQSESDFEDDEGIDSVSHISSNSYSEPSHPLLIDTILETIMKHLDLKSLITSRLVCKKWHRFGHYYIVSKSERVILEVYQPWKPSAGHKISKFMQSMRGSIETCPVSKFVLRNFKTFVELEHFFRKFGPIVKSLDLNFPKDFNENGAFRRVLFDYAPFIEHLRIECCKIMQSHDFWEFSEFEPATSKLNSLKTLYLGNIRSSITLNKNWIRQFFQMAPNLKKIILQVHFKDNGHRFINAVLETMLSVGNLERIKFLFLSSLSESNLRTLIKLAEKGLQLKTFKFQDICLDLQVLNGLQEPISSQAISHFLQTQVDCLETLKIEQRSNRVRGFVFPKMNALKHLHFISIDALSCGSLNYSQLFPKLETLTLRGYEAFALPHYFSEKDNTFPAGVNVRRLSLPSGLRDPNLPSLLARMFPNVRELEIRGASNGFLCAIWGSWPELESLKMVLSHFDGCLDSGLTGISSDDCLRIRTDQSYDSTILDDVKVHASIVDLQNLRDLTIECRAIWIPCHIITDVTGYFAIARMTQLRRFKFTEIGVPECFDLSETCIKKIHENLMPAADIKLQIMDDHGRWRLELEEDESAANMYETEPLLEDHNKDKVYFHEK